MIRKGMVRAIKHEYVKEYTKTHSDAVSYTHLRAHETS